MFGGLYGDLPQAKDEAEKKPDGAPGAWSGSTKIAPAAKRAAAAMPPPAVVLRGAGARGRGRDNNAGRGRGKPAAAPVAPAAKAIAAASPSPSLQQQLLPLPAAATSFFGEGVADEYDPARPNDYDAVLRRREQRRREAEAEAERQERAREMRELEALEERRRQEEEEMGMGGSGGLGGPEQAAAVDAARRAALSLNGEEAFLRRAGLGGGAQQSVPDAMPALRSTLSATAAAPPPPAPPGAPKGMSLAQKMLEKMGWREGEGLGRERQGIAAPLAVEKTDARSGRVVAQAPLAPPGGSGFGGGFNQVPSGFIPPPNAPQFDPGPPSRVLVLRNVVGPGQVDATLDIEVGEECSRYGEVLNVLIFEVTEGWCPEEEAVRVYVEFEEVGAATAAAAAMAGRFFGGRAVRAAFFDEVRFQAGNLAPTREEIV